MGRLRVSVSLAVLLGAGWLAPVDPAAAGRAAVRPAQAKKARAAAARAKKQPAARRGFPALIGEGWFSKVYGSHDGKYVMKKMKPKIGGVRPVSPKRRAEMARRTVRASELLRKSGLPVPESLVSPKYGDIIVQQRVRGTTFQRLPKAVRPVAEKNAKAVFRKANRIARSKKATTWYIDENMANLRFDKTGSVKAWIDPVVPIKGAEAWKVVDARAEQGL